MEEAAGRGGGGVRVLKRWLLLPPPLFLRWGLTKSVLIPVVLLSILSMVLYIKFVLIIYIFGTVISNSSNRIGVFHG